MDLSLSVNTVGLGPESNDCQARWPLSVNHKGHTRHAMQSRCIPGPRRLARTATCQHRQPTTEGTGLLPLWPRPVTVPFMAAGSRDVSSDLGNARSESSFCHVWAERLLYPWWTSPLWLECCSGWDEDAFQALIKDAFEASMKDAFQAIIENTFQVDTTPRILLGCHQGCCSGWHQGCCSG